MQIWTLDELYHLTRDELCKIASDTEAILPGLEVGTTARTAALHTLDNIRRVMLRRGFQF